MAFPGSSASRKASVFLHTMLAALLIAYFLRDKDAIHSPIETEPSSAREALQRIHYSYQNGVKEGKYVPYTYPMCTFGGCIFLIFLLIPPTSRLHNKINRYLTFSIVAIYYCWIIRNCRAQNVLPCFGIGILSSWTIIWTATTLIFRDGKSEYMRITMLDRAQARSTPSNNIKLACIVARDSISLLWGAEDARIAVSQALESSDLAHGTSVEQFVWQPYPVSPFASRLEWSIDILASMRGPSWNWRISHLPQPPPRVRRSLTRNTSVKENLNETLTEYERIENRGKDSLHTTEPRSGLVHFDKFWGVVLHNIYLLAKGFFFLDLLLTLGHLDPYFWGVVDPHPPGPSYLPCFIRNTTWLLRTYRLFISMSLISLSVQTLCAFGPLLFVGCFGPCLLGSNGEPWLYPDHFGSFQDVFVRGLAGWWGTWWHQNFRYAFNSGGVWLCSLLGVKHGSAEGRAIQLFAAFGLSGLLHAGGSITTIPQTRPWRGCFLFFILQPVGILMETLWRESLARMGLNKKIPKAVAYAAGFIFVHVWFYYTGPLVTDDFARGGVWLYEPVVVSLSRGLGRGGEGDAFFCWKGKWLGWHSDTYRRWWLSGVSF